MNKTLQITYRSAKKTDVNFLCEMLVVAVTASGISLKLSDLPTDPEGYQFVENFSDGPVDVGVIAETNGGVRIGAAWVRKLPVGAFPMNKPLPELIIGVQREYQSQGIGKRLLEALYVLLSERGIAKICLGVECHNTNAIRLYEKNGWLTYDKYDDFIVMSKVVGEL